MNKVVKIFVVVAIVIGVGGVWALKNAETIPTDDATDVNGLLETEEENSLVHDVSLSVENDPVSVQDISEDKQSEEPKALSEELVKVGVNKETEPEEPMKVDVKTEAVQEPVIVEEKPVVSDNLPIGKEEEPVKEPIEESAETVTAVVTPELVATEFDLEKLKAYKLPIMIEFGASWCTWCRWMEPTLEELNKEYAGKVVIQSVDVEKFRNEVSDFDVSLLPTIYFFDAESNVFETRVGAMTKDEILKIFESMGVENDG